MPGQVAVLTAIVDEPAAVTGALEALVRQHARFVYQVVYAVLRNHHDAEDATQETFLRVMRHQHQLPEVRDLRAWLARIAWRIAVDRSRTGTSGMELPSTAALEDLQDFAAHSADAERTAISAEMLAIAEMLVAGLPPDLRDVLRLSTVEEMTSGEIASVLDIPEGSVRGRLFRARQMLKNKMAALLAPPLQPGKRQEK